MKLVICLISIIFITSIYAKDEVKDAIVKKQEKVAPVIESKEANPKADKIGSGATGISCYQCNSGTKGEEDCASHDEEVLKKFSKPCPALPEGSSLEGITGAKSCRKIEQNVREDPTRIIRECAYTGDEELDGKKRTGNKGIINYLYVCFNDEDGKPCNPASQAVISIGAIFAFIAVQFYQRI